jgi:hypothetical protein
MSNRIPANSPDYEPSGAIGNFDLAFGVQYALVNGAITIKEGTVFMTKAGVAAMTLAVPVAGLQSAGGDDGRELVVLDTTGHAHTVTTPASGINGVDHIATFGGTVGQFGTFTAYNGAWYLTAQAGVTLS